MTDKTFIAIIALTFIVVLAIILKPVSDAAKDISLTKRLLGKWECTLEIKKEGITTRIDIENTFLRNDRYNAFGALSLDTPLESVLSRVVTGQEASIITNILSDTLSVDYWVSETGEWDVDDGLLIQTATDTKINRNTFTGRNINAALQEVFPKSKTEIIARQIQVYTEYLNAAFTAMMPQGLSDASEIVFHSDTSLSFISEIEGSENQCSRPTD